MLKKSRMTPGFLISVLIMIARTLLLGTKKVGKGYSLERRYEFCVVYE